MGVAEWVQGGAEGPEDFSRLGMREAGLLQAQVSAHLMGSEDEGPGGQIPDSHSQKGP